MTMPKRSLAELRKLRKINEAYEEAFKQITEGLALNSTSMIKKAVKRCDDRISEIKSKEEFLQKLETPKHEADADDILKRIRDRNARIQQKKMAPLIDEADESLIQKVKNLIEGKNDD